jgi:hypothetical protein
MTQILHTIPDDKVQTFLSFINDLKYVKVEEKEFVIPTWQKKEVKKRIKAIKSDPSQLLTPKESSKFLKTLKV